MSQCYKCQRELPDGQTECEPFCFRDRFSDEDHETMEREYLESTVQIDWDKIKTIQDLVLILRNSAMIEDRVPKDCPEFHLLKHLLKEDKS